MNEWKEFSLDNLIYINRKTLNKDYQHDKILYLDTGSITCNKIDSLQELKITDAPSRAKRIVNEDDIIYSSVRPNQLHYGYIKNPQKNLIVSTGFVVITCKKELLNPKFLYNYLTQDTTTEYLHSIAEASTTTYPSLKPSDIAVLEILLPPLPEQESISEVLSSLDDKIDLLHRQNKTLEELADIVLGRWFIEEAEVQSDNKILLGDYFDTISKTHRLDNEKVIFLNTSDIYKGEVLEHNYSVVKTLPGQAKKSIQKGDLLFSEIRPSNGRWAYISFESDDYVVSTKLMVLRSKSNIDTTFLYFYLTHKKTVDYLQMLAESRSGTFPQITFDQLRDLKINIPSTKILDETNSWCRSALEKISKNHTQIKQLESLRDELLPKLMSGAVRVQEN